jgi:hypothetical protein
MDLDQNPDILLVRKHLVEHLGPPAEVFEVRGSPIKTSPIQALHLSYFAPGGPEAPVVFSTCGACLYKMNDGRRVEAMMLLRREPNRDAFSAIHRLLSSFAIFSEANNEAVRIGDVVRAPDDLHKFCGMDAILFLPPVPFVETFHKIPITKGDHVELIWLLPVYEAEASYALKYGPQALMMLFAAQGLDLTQSDRDEANTLIQPEDARALAQKRSDEERAKMDAQGGPKAMPMSKAPPRRTLGAGSFEVADQGDAVAITRRGDKKPKAVRPVEQAPPPPPEPMPPQRTQPPPQKKPVLRSVGKPEPVVRFDVNAPKLSQSTGPATASKTPAAKPAPPPPKPETPEEAKKRRIDELKAKAADAAKRAAERQGGGEKKE